MLPAYEAPAFPESSSLQVFDDGAMMELFFYFPLPPQIISYWGVGNRAEEKGGLKAFAPA